jgi:hypothetical protein
MYLVGAAHPHKIDAQHRLEELIVQAERLVTDAEVFQEILHRFAAINRMDAIQPAFNALLGVVDQIYPIEYSDVNKARDILMGSTGISARDAIHVAVMQRYEIQTIFSFDSGFDQYPGVRRL